MSAMLEAERPLLSDAELLQRLATRDSTALIEVERRHWASLYAQVYGMVVESALAERVVREVFMELWFAAERFPLKRSLWNWLREMARELSRAELALGVGLGADADDELPSGRYRQGEKVDGDGPPRDACAG